MVAAGAVLAIIVRPVRLSALVLSLLLVMAVFLCAVAAASSGGGAFLWLAAAGP